MLSRYFFAIFSRRSGARLVDASAHRQCRNGALGASTCQFVKLANGQWISPGPAYASLVQTGARLPYDQLCQDGPTQPYAGSRGWDYSNVTFDVTNAAGDVQHFGFWKNNYWDNTNFCGITKGFRLTSWTFPQGPSINVVYASASSSGSLTVTGQLDTIVEVNNSLGRDAAPTHFCLSSFVENSLTQALAACGRIAPRRPHPYAALSFFRSILSRSLRGSGVVTNVTQCGAL
jgi:hypothetical protein